jgi:cobalt-zinc-cadmium efflux system membrane fusion protein
MRTERIRMLARIGFALCAFAIFLPEAGCSRKPQSDTSNSGGVVLTDAQRRNIQVFTVQPTKFHKSVEAMGVVDFDNEQATSVLAPFSGPVSQLLVAPGDKVTKGQALANVDSSDYASAVGAYRKALTAARNARRLADLDKDLLAHQSVSQREAEQAETDAVGAESDRDAARQALVSLNVNPAVIKDIEEARPTARIEGVIRSPIAGTVVERLVTPGELLQTGVTPCFTVADLSRVWVMAQLFGSDVQAVSVGDKVRIFTGLGSGDLQGHVENIADEIDPNTHSVAVRVVVDNPMGALRKQMYVRSTIEAQQESRGILVPVSAILRDDENLPFVYRLERDGSFARRHVTLAEREGERYAIGSGLAPGDHIVVDGAIFVQFMQEQ